MKNALVGVLTIAMYTTPKSAFFICPGHMKNAPFGVLYIAIVKHQRTHSSYEQVLSPRSVCNLDNKNCFKNKHYIIQMAPLDLPMSALIPTLQPMLQLAPMEPSAAETSSGFSGYHWYQ